MTTSEEISDAEVAEAAALREQADRRFAQAQRAQRLQQFKRRLANPSNANNRINAARLPEFEGLVPTVPGTAEGETREVCNPEGFLGEFIWCAGAWHLYACRSLCWLGEEPGAATASPPADPLALKFKDLIPTAAGAADGTTVRVVNPEGLQAECIWHEGAWHLFPREDCREGAAQVGPTPPTFR
jgi:hypothetical protein